MQLATPVSFDRNGRAPFPFYAHCRRPQGTMLAVSIEDATRAARVFEALWLAGPINLPLQDTFWAQGFGKCIEHYRTAWIVNCEQRNAAALGNARTPESAAAAA